MEIKKKIKVVVISILGMSMILIGIAGLFLPFLQGILFIIVGFVILSFVFPMINEGMIKTSGMHPRTSILYKKIRKYLGKYLG